MLTIKYIRENIDIIKQILNFKKSKVNLNKIIDLDIKRRKLIKDSDNLKSERNRVSELISEKKKIKESADSMIKNMKSVSESIKVMDLEIKK